MNLYEIQSLREEGNITVLNPDRDNFQGDHTYGANGEIIEIYEFSQGPTIGLILCGSKAVKLSHGNHLENEQTWIPVSVGGVELFDIFKPDGSLAGKIAIAYIADLSDL